MATDRVKRMAGHLGLTANSPDDVVIVSALRTPICKARRGGLKDMTVEGMLAPVLKEVCAKGGVRPEQVEDVCVGNVQQNGAGAVQARWAQFMAGFPYTSSVSSVNRQCSSGLQAVMNIAGSIKAGTIDIGIGAGVEHMTSTPMGAGAPTQIAPEVFESQLAQDTMIPMGLTSENVAEKYGVTREEQDKMALQSHQKAARAQQNGWFDAEIVPVTVKGEDGSVTVVSKDDGIRAQTTPAGLAKLKGAFKPDGSTTAGNSSQVSDGAAAVLLARRSVAEKMGLPVIGVIRSYAVAGVPPEVMGIGPAYAIPEALKKAGLTVKDVDVYEINEAFASQATYCIQKLDIPEEKLNPNGGAIALGHPLGCTGSRQIATLMNELHRTNKRYGVVSMCIGTGMGAAAVIEKQ
eukprot:Clim_evm37s156 gene=Clim_evmTU37s156